MFTTVLWIYIALLLVGGLIGFIKAKSKISLFTSAGFAIALAVCALNQTRETYIAALVLIGLLLVFFGMRFTKTKKFMPAGLMSIASAAALVVLLLNK